jgi:hypothetical protein
MIDRRDFILQGATLLAISPSLGIFTPLPPAVQVPHANVSGTHSGPAQFKIDGWDHFDAGAANENDFSFRLSQSWRASWR